MHSALMVGASMVTLMPMLLFSAAANRILLTVAGPGGVHLRRTTAIATPAATTAPETVSTH